MVGRLLWPFREDPVVSAVGSWKAFCLGSVVLMGVSCRSVDPYVDSGAGDSETWSLVADRLSEGVLVSMWAPSESEVLMVGGGMQREGPGVLVRYQPNDGELCSEILLEDRALWWIHGRSPEDYYAVGEKGTILHYTESEGWVDESVDYSGTLYGVWVADDEVWAVGGRLGGSKTGTGSIWRKDENGWTAVELDLPGVVFKVWEDHFVGHEVAYRLTESGELEFLPPGESKLLTVRGRSPTDIWAVGGTQAPEVLHFDGDQWSSVQTSGLGLPLMGVWTAPGEAVWVSGMGGLQAYSEDDGESWVIPDFPLTSNSFHSVLKHQDEVLFAGGNLMSSGPDYFGTIGRFGPPKPDLFFVECNN